MYSAIAVANYFIQKSLDPGGSPVTHMKIQKLVYFAHAVYMKKNEVPLIEDSVYVWKYGPVINSLYYELSRFGREKITSLIPVAKAETIDGKQEWKTDTPTIDSEDKDVCDFLDNAWEAMHGIDAWKLSVICIQIRF